MDPVGIILMLLVGAAAGWLAGTIFSGAGFWAHREYHRWYSWRDRRGISPAGLTPA